MLLDFEKKLASFVKKRHLLSAASNVVLAVSGGADSTALLYALRTLKDEKILTARFICAHVNHQLRGAEADSDEAFVVAEASALKLDVTTRRVDVRGFAREHKLSIETAARQCRRGDECPQIWVVQYSAGYFSLSKDRTLQMATWP